MKMSYWVLIVTFIACIAGGLVWSADHYHGKFLEAQRRADDAEQRADSSETITANVLRTVAITNIILETNQHAKQQIALESQRAENDIKAAVADDDCAVRVVPSGAVKRLHEYANSLRAGSGSPVTRQPDG
ncbi:TPA: DUF2570 domain-containing protein [Escherichia coli]|uniref:DUF2570 domain-containing protein n=1 Tax=Citrobacter TaxID=544 RepID=UPI0015EA6640|nr:MULTISPECIES: DUF2570 domain-containing protein [unclassified Citrobacter]HBC0863480.1 DUF2570 domain-containing protein [Escherichia coli]MBA7874132.1 DUF2570 domain-containing protein [Citrobacter sp. RHBSTW-00827]MBA7939910.1 DUF2570 domain-containing protein [Citrobacter sp. RHBSTW-00509]QLS95942.1 DUF2570 domain-containing protein [Citrobacter sp. RHBSTW-00859]QLT55317.1 DUF2570 domain-containing protein [Citrobacter sp. RHBSTW-00821]